MSDRLFPDELRVLSPNEKLVNFAFDFTDEIPSGDSLANATSTVTAKDDDENDVTGTVVSAVSVSGTKLQASLAGFSAGKNYLITYRGQMTTAASKFEKYLLIKCRAMSAVA